MEEPTILAGFSNVDLVDFQYHLGNGVEEHYILMKCKNRDNKRQMWSRIGAPQTPTFGAHRNHADHKNYF